MYKKKRRSKSKSKSFIFLAIIVYISYKLLTGFVLNPKTMVVNYGEIKNFAMMKSLFVRDEVLLKSPGEGIVEYFTKTGERIELGAVVAEIQSGDLNTEDRDRLMSINRRIEDIDNSSNDFFVSDINKLNAEINKLTNEIVAARKKGNYDRVTALNNQLISLADKKKRINGQAFSKSTLDRLRKEKATLESSMEDSIARVSIPMAGVISFYYDGYEDKLSPNNLYNLNTSFIESINVAEASEIKADRVIYNNPMFKLIDNSCWYLAIIITEDTQRFFKEGRSITVRVDGNEATLKVDKVLEDGPSDIAILKSRQYLKNFDIYRYKELEVVFGEYEGLKVYRDSVVVKDEVLGVYKTTIENEPRFVPIKIVGYDNDYVIVEGNSFLDKNREKVNTIKLYDEIYRNGKKYN